MLEAYLNRAVAVGDLTVEELGGTSRRFGDGSGPPIVVQLKPGTGLRIALDPELQLGESFMDGALTFKQGDVFQLLELVSKNPLFWSSQSTGLGRLGRRLTTWFDQRNGRRSTRSKISRHYDLSHDLYRRFLDEDMQYSCAYFADPQMSLEQAQQAKKVHIAAKLRLPPAGDLLDIGCGWGGLGISLARLSPGLNIVGVTLSREQQAVAERRAADAGVSSRLQFRYQDYRDVEGQFDRIVSVGMFEHVGRPHFQEYFDHISRLLTEEGVVLLHAIGRSEPPRRTQPFIAKYIFPGGYIPSLSEVWPAIEKAGLWVTDLEVLRLHYAETLKEWRRRFMARREEIAALYDERFCRMWEFYLASSEAGFRWFGLMIFQLQLAKRVDAVPLTRDYMHSEEQRLSKITASLADNGWAAAG